MEKVPKYRGLRLFIVSIILYYMLASPVIGMLMITNSPRLITGSVLDSTQTSFQDTIESVLKESKSITDSLKLIDSLKKAGITIKVDSTKNNNTVVHADLQDMTNNKGITGSEKLFVTCLIVSFILGFLFTIPFKVYFRRKRKRSTIPEFLQKFVRKTVLRSPAILALIIAIPFIFQNINLFLQHFIFKSFTDSMQQKMSMQYWAIFLLSGLLTIAFVFFWQKHNVQIRYLHHVFSRTELKKRIFRSNSGKIRNRLVLTSFLTTLLPLSIVVAYLLMSITSLNDLGIYQPSQGELKIIFGEYFKFVSDKDVSGLTKEFNLHYINVVDTVLLFMGIGMGIFVTIIYILFFVNWTNSDIIYPVKELLFNMQKTTAGQLENYSMVRTNDELGDLSENYNIMTSKLHEYITHIDTMNAELEQKVKERTAEIQAQKEEIEAQRDEVESQRDEIERQRDYVVEQRDLISLQNKAITDSIEYAAHIQSAILPPINELKKVLPDYFIYFKPRDIVSGDFYWAHRLKKKGGNKVISVAADSTGHGVPGAFMCMLGLTLLKEIVVKKEIYTPSEILDQLKENVINSLHQNEDSGKSSDGIDISICSIDIDDRKLEFAGAYNSVYIVRDLKDEYTYNQKVSGYITERIKYDMFDSKILFEIKADNSPVGLSHKRASKFALQKFDLQTNDIVYQFSDGYADQFGGKNRLKYLYSRFKKLLAGISSESMEGQYQAIDKELTSWKGKEKQIDDVLVMGLRIP